VLELDQGRPAQVARIAELLERGDDHVAGQLLDALEALLGRRVPT
jgi:hypothetical protein